MVTGGLLGVCRKFFAHTLLLGFGVSVLCALFAPAYVLSAPGINQQINFQGRLLNQQGAVVPDGYYNVQFKIYQDGDGLTVGNPSGTLLWTESHLNANSQGVQVKNGFMSVQLGSVTAFGTSIDWNQDTLWLSMNIGDTNASCTPFSSCNPDGEMVPMKRLSSTPYALNAGRLGGLTSAEFLQLSQGVQTDSVNATSININKTGTGDFISLQANGDTAFTLSGSGDISFGNNTNHSISVEAAGAGLNGVSLTVKAGDAGTGGGLNGGDLILQGGSGSASSGSVIVKSNTVNSATAFQVQNTTNNPVLTVDTSNGRVQIGSSSSDSTGVAMILDSYNGSDESSFTSAQNVNGAMYYNASNNKFRCYQNSVWMDCLNSDLLMPQLNTTTLQEQTENDSDPATIDVSSVPDGSWMLLTAMAGGNSSSIFATPPTGWTTLVASFQLNTRRVAIYGKIKESSDGVVSLVKGTTVPVSIGVVYGKGGTDPSEWQIGTGKTRNTAPSESNTTTGLSITTQMDNVLALSISVEATNNDDVNPPVTSGNGWENWLYVADEPTNIEQIRVNYKEMPSAGPTGNVTDTYQHTQTLNGYGIQIGITPSESTLSQFVGASAGSAGYEGLVLAPGAGQQGSVLLGNGTWSDSLTLISTDLYLGNGAISAAPSDFTISGTDSSANGEDGGIIILKGGDATVGTANGGNINITGGTGSGSGVKGLVIIDTPTFSTATTQICGGPTPCPITQASIDNHGAVVISATAADLEVTMPDPTNTTAGRIVYVTAADGSEDFSLVVNGGGTGNEIAMRANTTATMVWNGSDWTAAGASSSTTLQAAYNNTLTSAGGAEIVLNPPGGSADGLTIRNGTIPITGGILEVQSSIGTNLFSVNNLGTELAANGGSETDGTWTTNWTAVGGATVTRTTDNGEYVTGQAGVQVVTTTTANIGVRNNLSGNPVNSVGAEYQVSFTAKSSLNGTPIEVLYSRNGGTNTTACTDYGGVQSLSDTVWTKITCTIVIDSATAATNPDLIIRKTNTTAPTIWIDNLSFMRNDTTTQPSNVQIGGGINGGPVTLFTLDRSSAPPVANGDTTYLGSMYYDTTTGRIQCYESDGWGACGSAPDEIVTLTPEYTGAVLNGSGIGTLTADFCSNDTDLQVNVSFCADGLSRNYYRWTSPQATQQTYSIYVSYKLPSTFKAFSSSDTITLTALTDSTSNGVVDYQIFRSSGSDVTSCGSQTDVTSSSANTWHTVPFSGDETACGFQAGEYIIFKINVRAQSNANVYVENLDFTYLNI